MCVCMCEIGISRFWNMVVGFGGYGKGKKKCGWMEKREGREEGGRGNVLGGKGVWEKG